MWRFFLNCFQIHPEQEDSARAQFAAWEKLRILFNGVLVAFSLLFIVLACVAYQPLNGTPPNYLNMFGRLLSSLIFGPIVVNVAYCVGPVAEGYLVLFRINREMARGLLFTLGLMAAITLAFASIFGAVLWAL